ncbi:M60 family metallopeptidase [Candidatus Palauibacter sp.]|uniref:M60 family metallopeptidase n=1 Tax=Candidatus Palauibacter sp. TaxID=3101350 RepID=UPI003B5B4401
MGLSLLVAGSFLGSGRVVAFSGQDFLGSDDRATLLGHGHADRLLANAVRWTAGVRASPLRVLADNQRIADALAAQGLDGVDVVSSGRGSADRDWSASALDGADVAVVQVNEWGTARLISESVGPLRRFVERGGGLVIAGSAFHWSWWIERSHGAFSGNTLLRGTGISWNEDSIETIASASTRIDLRALTPGLIWGQYLSGGGLDAAQMWQLPGLFSAALELGRTEELDSALVRLVSETPPLPASADAPEARLSADVASSLGPHEWPETHPWATTFPGLPARGTRGERGSVVVDATWGEFPADARRRERHFPLEFYAPPGGLVTISVPSSHATGELAITVGQEHNDLRQIPEHAVWRWAPALRRTFSVTTAETEVTNAYGGALALVVPGSYRGTIPVTVEGAIPMAVYTAGESNGADWFAALSAGAPQAIIQKPGGIRFVISAESARRITDPGEVSVFWDGFRQHHAELAGEPVSRAYESIWIFDPQVGCGYANAGWLTINYPLHGEHWVLVPGTAEGRAWLATLPNDGPQAPVRPPPTPYSPAAHGVNWWLFGHELGHQWQTEDWGGGSTYPEIGEVAVNLFTMYTLNGYIFGGDDSDIIADHRMPNSVDHAALSHLRWPTADVFQRLQMYRQLIFEFGWEPMKAVFRSYYDPAYPRSTYGGELDGFAIRFSAIVQRDLVRFLRHWEYPLSESAEATIRSFGLEEWLPPGW